MSVLIDDYGNHYHPFDCKPMNYVRSAEPSTEPITVAEAKQHMRVDNDDEDLLISSYITAARRWCEEYTRRSFINTTWVAKLDYFPSWMIELEKCPLSSVTSIAYVDTNGTTQTLSSSLYSVSTHSTPGLLTPAYGQTWPSTRAQMDAVTITFVAGYGTAATSIPQTIRNAVKIMTAHLYENRELIVTGTIVAQVPLSIESLLWSERWSIR